MGFLQAGYVSFWLIRFVILKIYILWKQKKGLIGKKSLKQQYTRSKLLIFAFSSPLKSQSLQGVPGVLGTGIHYHLCKRTGDICTLTWTFSERDSKTKFLRDQGTCIPPPPKKKLKIRRPSTAFHLFNSVQWSKNLVHTEKVRFNTNDRGSRGIDASAKSNRRKATSISSFHCRKPPCPPVPFLGFHKNNLKVTVYTPGPGETLWECNKALCLT